MSIRVRDTNMARNLLYFFEKKGIGGLAFDCCAPSSCIKLLVLQGHPCNVGDRSVPACSTIFVVILTLQATSAQALAVPPQKACYAPSTFVHMALWSRAQTHVPSTW